MVDGEQAGGIIAVYGQICETGDERPGDRVGPARADAHHVVERAGQRGMARPHAREPRGIRARVDEVDKGGQYKNRKALMGI